MSREQGYLACLGCTFTSKHSHVVKEHIESNLKVEQVLLRDKWSVSLHMLNYLETGVREHPNGAPNLFRLFVGSRYHF